MVDLGKPAFTLDSKAPTIPLEKYIYNETRYTMLRHSDPKAAQFLLAEAQEDVNTRFKMYEQWANMPAEGDLKGLAQTIAGQAQAAAKGAGSND